MKKLFLIITILASTVILAFISQPKTRHSPPNLPALVQAQTTGTDWPQVQKDAAHTGYSSETLGTNFKVAWTHPFQPDRVHPQVQAIIYRGKAFVGTEGANGQKPTLYALNSTNGQEVWKFEAGGSILNSVAADNGKVYFGSLDGAVYAVYSDTENGHNAGQLAWKQQLSQRLGFSVAPIIADNKVMLGGRDSNFYALNQNDGQIVWQYNVGKPIYQTAAYDQGKVFFGAQDISVYALNTTTGALVWKTNRLNGTAFKDYWPMVYQGRVFIRPVVDQKSMSGITPGYPFGWHIYTNEGNTFWSWLSVNGPTIAAGNASQIPEIMHAQDQIMNAYQTNPNNYASNLYILDENTGQQTMVVPHFTSQTMNGATAPPCVDSEGKLIVPLMFVGSGWGRLDLTQGRITDILYDGYMQNGQFVVQDQQPAGFGNEDENNAVSCSHNLILGRHIDENPISANGAFNLNQRRWTYIHAGKQNSQMQHNTQGGGTNAYAISNGMIYDVVHHELIARTTN